LILIFCNHLDKFVFLQKNIMDVIIHYRTFCLCRVSNRHGKEAPEHGKEIICRVPHFLEHNKEPKTRQCHFFYSDETHVLVAHKLNS
jgi:hypothetical protein